MQTAAAGELIARLPRVKGPYQANAAIKDLTWFRAGGPAEVLYLPPDADDLAAFLKGVPADVPVMVIGVGSNLLVRDGGVDGVVIRLGRGFMNVIAEGNCLRAGASALDVAVSKAALDAGLSGLEFMRGIPGAVGGGLRMNAGAYGREFKDVLVEAVALDRKGERVRLSNADMRFEYRRSHAPDGLIFVEGVFQGTPGGDKAAIEARMNEITDARASTQPIKSRTGGSTFKNPPGEKAWQLVDRAGCRGLRRGDAEVSTMHCNFLINHDRASGNEIEDLGEEVRAKVKVATGIELEWEIKRIGKRS